jgi:signal transduction histidine kinase
MGQAGTVPAALLDKLKLLPLRERELATLRQAHQHQQLWIEGTQELMVRLANASSIPEAVLGLAKSLVHEFGFDISCVATADNLLAGDAANALTAADQAFMQELIARVRASGELAVAECGTAGGERTLAWLMAGLSATNEAGEGPIVVVGRTTRTAPYYPAPKGNESSLYRHLLASLAQVFRAIALAATQNSELERKVAERTSALHAAQKRVVELEKEKIAEQMAGGFAHEMRNALSGAKILIEKGMGAGSQSGQSLIDESAGELTRLYVLARERLDADELSSYRSGVQVIARNERMLHEILESVLVAIQRALAITALIMEYSRVGFSRRGVDVIDVATIARSIVAESTASFEQQSVRAQIQAERACLLRGNEAHLYSILKNLIINAFDALCEVQDGRTRCLTIQVRSELERVVCRVEDNAGGIPEEFRSRIFEPFFSTKPQTGTGLGLGMVLKLVTLHDGTLDLQTVVGEGTTFTISLPSALDSAASAALSEGRAVRTGAEYAARGERVAE